MSAVRVYLWLQRPPRVQWVLKVRREDAGKVVIVRTWLDEYSPAHTPPPAVVTPLVLALDAIAKAALAGGTERRIRVELPNG